MNVESHETRLSAENALEIIREYDIVVDGTDNFPTRYLVNDACVLLDKPNVYGSIFRFEGQASVFYAKEGPCYRCLYSEPPPPGLVPSCAEGGVLGVLPGIIGSIQALETIKLILGTGDSLIGRLVLFDALKLRFRELKLRKDPDCPICGDNPTIRELIDYEAFCGIGAAPAYQGPEVVAEQLKQELDDKGDDLVLIDVREPHEWEIAHIDGARLIPLGQLPDRIGELDGHAEIVTYCHKGVALDEGAGDPARRRASGRCGAWPAGWTRGRAGWSRGWRGTRRRSDGGTGGQRRKAPNKSTLRCPRTSEGRFHSGVNVRLTGRSAVRLHAEGGTRTRTGLRPLRPERSASTSSTTSAKGAKVVPLPEPVNPRPLTRSEVVAYPLLRIPT